MDFYKFYYMTKIERMKANIEKLITIFEEGNRFVLKTAEAALSKIKYIDFILFNVCPAAERKKPLMSRPLFHGMVAEPPS